MQERMGNIEIEAGKEKRREAVGGGCGYLVGEARLILSAADGSGPRGGRGLAHSETDRARAKCTDKLTEIAAHEAAT